MIRCRLISILIGAGLDCLIGDPQWMPHPVRFMGALISALEKLIRREEDTPGVQRIKGVVVVVFVLSTVIQITWGILARLYGIHTLAGIAAESVLCCYALAARSLGDAAMEVYRPLAAEEASAGGKDAGAGNADGTGNAGAAGNLEKARRAVSMIVGRDTKSLDRAGIIRAAVETVAENTADGVIAPLFYMALGGAVGAMAYKAVNTMDSMLGYRNEQYQYFGTAAARLDDVAGFVPARLSGLLLVAAAKLTGLDAEGAWRIFCRDRYAHKSPNSAQSESACAGALGVRLAGDAVYSGRKVSKPYIGDATREIEAEDIVRSVRLMYAASGLGLLAVAVSLMAVIGFSWR